MKTYKAKSSVKRAIVKSFGTKVFEAGSVEEQANGEWMFIPAPEVVETPKVEEEKNMVQVEINQSTIGKPCSQVWEIAIEMNEKAEEQGLPAPARKAVIEACVDTGIAFNTARTQYQAWFKASKA